MADEYPVDFPEYIQAAKLAWEGNADWWDNQIGQGNDFQNYLIEPQTEKIAGIESGRKGPGYRLRRRPLYPPDGRSGS